MPGLREYLPDATDHGQTWSDIGVNDVERADVGPNPAQTRGRHQPRWRAHLVAGSPGARTSIGARKPDNTGFGPLA
jgi:hypothetical protein